MDNQGYIKITGRLKDLIIRGGENIHPLDIENCLLGHDAISDASACGVPDDRYGEVVAVFVILHKGMQMSEEEVREWVRGSLSRHLGEFFFGGCARVSSCFGGDLFPLVLRTES